MHAVHNVMLTLRNRIKIRVNFSVDITVVVENGVGRRARISF